MKGKRPTKRPMAAKVTRLQAAREAKVRAPRPNVDGNFVTVERFDGMHRVWSEAYINPRHVVFIEPTADSDERRGMIWRVSLVGGHQMFVDGRSVGDLRSAPK